MSIQVELDKSQHNGATLYNIFAIWKQAPTLQLHEKLYVYKDFPVMYNFVFPMERAASPKA